MENLPFVENGRIKLIQPSLIPMNILTYKAWLEDPKVIRGIGGLEKYSIQDVFEILTDWRADPLERHWFIYSNESGMQTPIGDLNLSFIVSENEGNFIEFLEDFDLRGLSRKAELKIMISGEYQGKGIGKKALASGINYGFNQMKLDAIYASVYKDNYPSLALFKNFEKLYDRTDFRNKREESIFRLKRN